MQFKIQSSTLKATFNSIGAELCSVKNNNGVEFIWQANKSVWARHAPVLFPIVGKLKDNFFNYDNQKHELPQHGFARDMNFELLEGSSESCTFQLQSNDKTKQIFPFDFVFQINYQLVDNKLITSYKVNNPSYKPLFFSVGAHPGFNCPLLPNETFSDYYLEFEKSNYNLTQLDNGLRLDVKNTLNLPNKKLFLSKELFHKDALVFENNQINKVSLCSSKSDHKITIENEGWPYFGIWSKNENQQFVCLEPWHGIADKANGLNEFIKKDGIIELAPYAEFNCSFSLFFK